MSRDVDERVERLRERADRDFPESWVPERPGDEIAGELVRYDRGNTSYGEQIIAVLRTPEGAERSVWLLHAVLRGEFARLRPKPAEFVLVRYDGKKQSGAGTAYASYRVEIDRDEAPPDWEALGADAAADSTEARARVHAPLEHDGASDDVPF